VARLPRAQALQVDVPLARVQAILVSYRWRRRLAWIGGSLAVVTAIVLRILLLPKGSVEKHPGVRPGPVQDFSGVGKRVRVTRAQRRAVNETLLAFIRTGVTRDDPAAAWTLVTPAMRSGVSRAEWNAGQLPVTPYPARIPKRPDWSVLTSFKGDLTIDLLLQPERGAKQGPIAFAVELKQARDGRWLIDSMAPEHIFTPAEPPSAAQKAPKPLPKNFKPAYARGRLSPLWFVIPGALLGLIVLVPLLIVLLSWRRNRAIERRYRQERGL
jgi:hypothetical protein